MIEQFRMIRPDPRPPLPDLEGRAQLVGADENHAKQEQTFGQHPINAEPVIIDWISDRIVFQPRQSPRVGSQYFWIVRRGF